MSRACGLYDILVFPGPDNVAGCLHDFDVRRYFVQGQELSRAFEQAGLEVAKGNVFCGGSAICRDVQNATATVDVKPDDFPGAG